MSLSSTLCPANAGTLWGGLYQTVDPLGSLLDKDEDSLAEGVPSPFSSSPSYIHTILASPSPILSPPSPHLSLLGDKVESDLLSLPWLSDELLDATISPDARREDAFSGMDWMAEKIDLSEFDLDSLVGSCDTDEAPTSPESLTSSLEPHMELDPQPEPSPFSTSITEEVDVSLSEDLAFPSAAPEKVEMKIEPPSPVPSPSLPPSSPSFTLDLGSEVDVSESEKTAPVDSAPVPKIILSFSPSLVLLLSPEEKLPTVCTLATVTPDDHSDSDSGISSVAESLQHEPCLSPLGHTVGSSRTKPYSPSSKSDAVCTGKVKSASTRTGPKVVEKKLKKMEQNKTAATRYRQKKRAEQEALVEECTELETRNRELEEKAESISKEIQYLKDLMEEVRNAKNRRSKGGNRAAS
ncbi:cyclic AMP-dependent transcription factor ATF-4-like [Brienomyrus brachyistius]|uniref:cyclic AMP-dependent transcription factor ATF-4-like n=1 Tax=Brienomyrus brachyistius TaxID=42636 RepID=UPI0020B21D1F|nr:cyclic AMP-dependent transcription factor ATF-4-like [Brienomyrus brachyistius]